MILSRVLATLAVLVASTAVPAQGHPPVFPSDAGVAALEVLSAPSHPAPLMDSERVTASTYRVAADCAGVRAAYSAPGAPVPDGSTVSTDASGVVQVSSPFSTSAVIGDDSSGSCEYTIATSPTVSISGPTLTVSAFSVVMCTSLLGLSVYAGEADIGGIRQVVFASPDGDAIDENTWRAVAAPGTIAELFANPSRKSTATMSITGTALETDGAITVTATDGTTVHLACTPAAPRNSRP